MALLKLDSMRERVERLVQDLQNQLNLEEMNLAIESALKIYSMAYPCYKVKDQDGDGSLKEWAVEADWLEEFSALESVEYPAGDSDERKPPYLKPKKDYDIVRTATNTFVWRLMRSTPADGETVRFTYTTIHTITNLATTLTSSGAEKQVIFVSAAICETQLAAIATQRTDNIIEADVIEGTSAVQYHLDLAERFAQLSGLKDLLEQGFADEEIASYTKEIDSDPELYPDLGFMIHRDR